MGGVYEDLWLVYLWGLQDMWDSLWVGSLGICG